MLTELAEQNAKSHIKENSIWYLTTLPATLQSNQWTAMTPKHFLLPLNPIFI